MNRYINEKNLKGTTYKRNIYVKEKMLKKGNT